MIKECPRCLFNTEILPDLCIYDASCSECVNYDRINKKYSHPLSEIDSIIKKLISKIKKQKGVNNKYDSVLGISGGIDSCYLALKVKEYGLNPLMVHLDNGWDTEGAISNIKNIALKTGFDLETYVIEWNEFKEMQKAYLRASVIDLELLTDHAITSTLFMYANKYNVKYILNGANYKTESIMPNKWAFRHDDHVNIKDIVSKHSNVKIRTYPLLTWFKRLYYKKIKKIQTVSILNYLPYKKSQAIIELEKKIGFKSYPQKHFDSIITRFYQGYILPKKFGVDKRVAHLSNLILSGDITKQEAKKILLNNEYTEEMQKKDYDYFIKKLELTPQEFENYITTAPRSHLLYKIEKGVMEKINIFKTFAHLKN